jgi:hypothetical protein
MTQRQRRQVTVRVGVLCGAVATLPLLALGAVVPGSSAGTSLAQVDPAPVTVILAILSLLTATAGIALAVRVSRRSAAPSVPSVACAGLAGALCLLGLMSVGPFLVPTAIFLLVVALPLDAFAATPSRPGGGTADDGHAL